MPTSLQFQLREGYREPIASGIAFVGRERELARLQAIIRNRPSATVLISGHRGVGKTTLVEQALIQNDDPNLLVVRLSLPHIYGKALDASREIRSQVLRSLARSLHFAVKDSKAGKTLKEQAESLYEKTYLIELHEHGQFESLTQTEAAEREQKHDELSINPGKSLSILIGAEQQHSARQVLWVLPLGSRTVLASGGPSCPSLW